MPSYNWREFKNLFLKILFMRILYMVYKYIIVGIKDIKE